MNKKGMHNKRGAHKTRACTRDYLKNFAPCKRSQMQLSFGMIFSIFLIIIFLVVSFYAIRKFLSFQETIKIEKFFNDLQSDVDKIWKSAQASQKEEYFLPKKIEAVCFTDREDEEEGGYNLYFRSERIIREEKIENIDINEIIKDENPFCIKNENGKIKMRLVKNFGESLVTIKKIE